MSFILNFVKTLMFVYFVLYALAHALVLYKPESVVRLFFQNAIHWPGQNFTHPVEQNLTNVHNFYHDVEPGVRIGVWHFIPDVHSVKYDFMRHSTASTKSHLKKYLSVDKHVPIMIYVHGNDRDRAATFRTKKCAKLNAFGYHIFAVDYRGYGDSTGTPSETGVVNDVVALHTLLLKENPNASIYMYGHSLGTAIVTAASRKISEANAKLDAIVLESPFLNAKRGSRDYHLSLLFNNNKWIQQKTDEALDNHDIKFKTDENIQKVKSKIFIYHAEDDWFIPVEHAIELHNICTNKRPKHYPTCKFTKVRKEMNVGHFPSLHEPSFQEIKKFLEQK